MQSLYHYHNKTRDWGTLARMKKRGPIVVIGGAVLIVFAMALAYSTMPKIQSIGNGQEFFPSPESMFDNVSDKVTIEPGNTYTFSHTTNAAQIPMMWGLHIVNYQSDNSVSVTISNIFGDKFGAYTESDPIFIKSFTVPKVDTYNFNVENKGKDTITITMMFSDNPEKSKALTDPNSPFVKNIVPLALAGFMLIIGIVVIISGVILGIMDWKRGKNQSRYI